MKKIIPILILAVLVFLFLNKKRTKNESLVFSEDEIPLENEPVNVSEVQTEKGLYNESKHNAVRGLAISDPTAILLQKRFPIESSILFGTIEPSLNYD